MIPTCSPRASTPARRFVPLLEVLEERRLLAARVIEAGSVLSIIGDNKANDVQVVDDGVSLVVTCDGKTIDHSDDVTSVVVYGGNGDDTVTYQLTGDLTTNTMRSIRAFLGNGQDSFDASLNGNLLAGATLKLAAWGSNGKDTLSLDGASDVAEGALLMALFNGGNANDDIRTTLTGILLGDLQVEQHGENGSDLVAIDLTLEAGSTGNVSAKGFGGNGVDLVTLNVQDDSGDDGNPGTTDTSTLASLVAVLHGGRGMDYFEATDNVDVLLCERAR